MDEKSFITPLKRRSISTPNNEIKSLLEDDEMTPFMKAEPSEEESNPSSPLTKFNLPNQPSLIDNQEILVNEIVDNSLWCQFIKETMRPDKAPELIARNEKERVQHFLNGPKELEKFLLLGFSFCLESFLDIFIIWPFRIVFGILSLLFNIIRGKK
jgi:hypothetical protein